MSSFAAGSVTLAWDASPDASAVGYRIYYGPASGVYTNSATVGNVTSATLTGLVDGATYFFAATAYNSTGDESLFSNEANYTVPAISTNQRPTLDAIANVTISEDAGVQTVNLSGISSGSVNENQTLTVTAVSSNPNLIANPTVSYISPETTGALLFTPAANANGSAQITVTVNDGQSANNTIVRTFTVTVTAVNDVPTLAGLNSITINEDAGAQSVSLSGISSGAPNETQTLSVTATSSNPALIPNPTVNYNSPNASGSLSVTPLANANGSATITVTVNDGQAANNTVTRTFTVTVNPVNDAPTLNALNNLTLSENAGLQTVNLNGIGTGAPNESQTLTITATSSNPGLIPNPTVNYTSPNTSGSLSFTPVANADGSATITVTVNDGQAANNTITRTFSVNVNAVNNPPTLAAINAVTIDEDAGAQTVNLTGIGTGAPDENQTLTITAVSSNPGLVPDPTVSYTSPNSTGILGFAPVANGNGSATITVTVNDGQSANNTTSQVFTVSVNPVNDAPTLNALNNLNLAENAGPQTVNLSGIGPGAANEAQTLTVTATSSDPSLIPNPSVNYTSPNATGSLSFTPVPGANGSATVTVTVNDGQSANNTVSRSFTVVVSEVNNPPTLDALSNVTIAEDAGQQTVSLSGISAGATNENQTLTVTATSSNPGLIPNPTANYISPSSTGSLNFTPAANSNGTATITVTVNDGQAINNTIVRTFTVNVNSVNDAPTLATINNVTINEDSGVQTVALGGISSGAPNESQTLSITATSSNPGLIPNPTVSYSSPSASGSLSFTPAADASGSATITVTVNDGQAANNTAVQVFTVTVNSVNDAPTLSTIANLSIPENAGLQTVSLTGIGTGAANEADTLTITATSSNPSLVPHVNVNYASPNATGSLTFTPAAGISGSATITVTVNDGQAANSTVVRTFSVNVNVANTPPTLAAINNVTVNEDAGVQTVNLSGISSGSANENQTLTVTAASSNPGLIPNPTVNYTSPSATGSLSFTPAAGSNGTATITVTVNDGHSVSNTVTRAFTVTVNAVNDPPTLNPIGNVTVNEDSGTQTLSLAGISSGAANENQTLTVSAISSNPGLIPNPTVSYTSPNATGTLSFTPAANANGTATITVTVSDGQAASSTVLRVFTVTVNPVNDAPTLNNLSPLTIAENSGPRTVNLSGIGSGAPNETQTLTISAVSSDTSIIPNPTVNYASPNPTGSLQFTPVANANGTATITVTVDDGQPANNSVTRSFVVTVSSVNSAPTITAIPNQTIVTSGSSGPIPFTISDVETPAASLSVTASSTSPSLLPVANIVLAGSSSNRLVTLTPVAGQTGTANVTLTVGDGALTASTTFQVTVQQLTSQLSLSKTGQGTVTPDLNNTTLIVGQRYTVTAKPAAGYEFGGWTGSIVSSSSTLTFVMTSNLVLQANFVATPYATASGTYNGLFNESDEVRLNSAGAFNVYAGVGGEYSGWAQLGFARYPFSGKLDVNLRATNVISRYGTTPLVVELQIGQGAQAGQIVGRLTGGDWSSALVGGRASGSSTNAGNYTVVVPGLVGDAQIPAGDGYATLHVGSDGLATMNGTLADGTKFMQSAYVTDDGDWPVYVSLYAGKGAIVSWMRFANLASSDVGGDLVWMKQSGASATSYPAGFISQTKAVGSIYTAPPASGKAVNLSSAILSFSGGELPANFSNTVSVNSGSQVVNLSENNLAMTITAGSGAFSGQVRDPSGGILHSFGGVLLQKQNAGYGLMNGTSASSRVVLAAP
ncbi:MAG TPA: Ig-like domain-containing protein [Verrucomicrobiae bacterium]|nr:Ig-like domain-containing protein [Verrucomicrobiae bacterium]